MRKTESKTSPCHNSLQKKGNLKSHQNPVNHEFFTKIIKSKGAPVKKTEEKSSYSRQNSMGSNLSTKNAIGVPKAMKDKVSIVRSHSSRSRQDDFLISKEENPFSRKVESLLQEKNYEIMSDTQILQENNLLRMHLKNFNKELNNLIERQALKPTNRATDSQFKSKPASARLRTLNEEIKNNEKKLAIFREELSKYSKRMELISEGTYLVSLQEKIENKKKNLEEEKKTIKLISLDQKKQGKNLDNLENVVGVPDKLAKGNEIASLLPGLTGKNHKLKERNELVITQIEELERKHESIQEKYEKAMQLAEAYKLFRNDKKREQYETTQNKVESYEKNIQMIAKKNDKVLEMHKRAMEDLNRGLREKDEQISLREKELLLQRQKIEELMLTEKVNKDSLMKILPPTPKTNNTNNRRKTDTPLISHENEREEAKLLKQEQNFESHNNKVLNEVPKVVQKEEPLPLKSQEESHSKKSFENDIIKEVNEIKGSIATENEVKREEPAKMFKFNKGVKDSNTDSQSLKKEDQQQAKTLNSPSEEPKMLNFNKIVQSPKPPEEQKAFNGSKKEPEEIKKPVEEPAKSFNFSRKKEDSNKLVLQENTNNHTAVSNSNNSANSKKPEFNKPLNGPMKKEKKLDLFSNNDDGGNFGEIPEIKTIENNNTQTEKANEKPINSHNFSENNTNKMNNINKQYGEEFKPQNENIVASKPRKIIADPFEEKPKVNNLDNEFFEEEGKTKKLKMGSKKTEKTDFVTKAEKGDNDFFNDFD